MRADRLQALRARLQHDAVELHLRSFFRDHEGLRLERAPDAAGLQVMIAPPGPHTSLWTYVSLGAHAARGREAERAHEAFLLAPEASDAHVQLVSRVASGRLAVGETPALGRPWLPGSACTHVLLCTPYPFGPALEHCDGAHGPVQVLWMLPITERERDYRLAHGLDALEQRFEAVGLDHACPGRASVV